MTKLSKNKVILGLSGGVDSTAAALLLKEQGLEVTGYYFDITGKGGKGKEDAELAAEKLGIRLICEDVSEEFDRKIISSFCDDYCSGRTPNPCIFCNPLIKFRKLIETADREGAYYIATGHYAGVFHDVEKDAYFVKKGASIKKDQSYMLYRLGQDVLSRVIFPLNGFEEKETIREIARKSDLPNADAGDSQEICFIDEKAESRATYMIRRGCSAHEGNFVDADGKILGTHKGILNYTIGQRKGLGIALGKPAFVTSINPEKNEVVLGENEDLFKKEVISVNNVFTSSYFKDRIEEGNEIEITAKIRYAAKHAKGRIKKTAEGKILTAFEEPQRAPAPGQSVVFYDGDCVIGGGIIYSEQR